MTSLNEFTHPSRMRILKILQLNPSTLTEITKSLNLSKPEVSRHLARMREAGLIVKDDRIHSLSNLGELILVNTSSLYFILEEHDYFKNHQVIDIPESLLRQLDSLSTADLIIGTGYLMKKMGEMNNLPANQVKIMVDQPFPGTRNLKVNEALFIVPIYAKDENLNLTAIKETSDSFEIRTLPVVNISFGILDNKFGFLFFPNLRGKIDYNAGFIISDPLGMEFMLNLWDYFYKKSKLRIKS